MIDELLATARSHRHRLPIMFYGPLASARAMFRVFDPVVLSLETPATPDTISPEQARALLGQEISGAIVNIETEIDADAIGVLSGAIRAGGILCFVVNQPAARDHLPYLQRFLRRLATDNRVTVIGSDKEAPATMSPVVDTDLESGNSTATQCQADAVEQVLRVISGQRRRPTILVADRGRGKSAALGIAADRLLTQCREPIVVTGASRKSADAVFRHAGSSIASDPSLLSWISPDRLERGNVNCQLLLIDEAASLPIPLLERLIRQFPRVALATTVHGYEGSGRGFLLRFKEILARHARGYRWINMITPVRWAPDDPLESTTNQLLVLDADVEELTDQPADLAKAVSIETVSGRMLAEDESLLRKVFGLLVLSHYKTQPKDLQRILDDHAITILVAMQEDLLVGVAVVVAEGGISPDLGGDIASGRRRPEGHVLPELLAINGFPSAPALRILRIMRIVVHPGRRRRGIGSQLLKRVSQLDADLLGANFSLTAPTVRFWRRNGYQPVQIGRRKTVQGGSHSGTMITALSEHSEKMVEKALDRFLANLPVRLGTTLSNLDSDSVQALLVHQTALQRTPSADTIDEILDLVQNGRDPDSVAGSLTNAAIHGIANDWFKTPLPVIERILQHRHWQDVSGQSGSTGWRQGNALIRKLFLTYLEHLNHTSLATRG